jgi:hypothetical protein
MAFYFAVSEIVPIFAVTNRFQSMKQKKRELMMQELGILCFIQNQDKGYGVHLFFNSYGIGRITDVYRCYVV